MFQIYFSQNPEFGLKELSQIAQVIIAIANLGLGYYVFIYSRGKDQRSEKHSSNLYEQNIRLQWFKELVLQPNQITIKRYFDNLEKLQDLINPNKLDSQDRQNLSLYIKTETAYYRKNFVDLLKGIDQQLANDVKENMDNLFDSLTKSLFDPNINLKNSITYEKEIQSKIASSYNNLISLIYNYKGLNAR